MSTSKTATSAKSAKTAHIKANPTPMKSPLNKKKPVPNGSILSFFKKVPPPDDLFVGGADASLVPEVAVEEDLYNGDGPTTERYHELEVSVKRRKLSGTKGEERNPPPGNNTRANADHPDAASSRASKLRPPKGRRKGPFLDDSDTDDDDSVGADNGGAAQFIKTPPSATDARVIQETSTANGDRRMSLPTTPSPKEERKPDSEREAEPDPDILEDEPYIDEFRDLDNADDLFGDEELGEEGRERMFMEEQARIEAAEADEAAANNSCAEGVGPVAEEGGRDSADECCPICTSSLAGLTVDQATVHVNGCLDGKPTPVPSASKNGTSGRAPLILSASSVSSSSLSPTDVGVDTAQVGKRFARAAVARPGQVNPITLGTVTSSSAGRGWNGGDGGNGGNAGSGTSAFAKLMSGHAENSAWAAAAAAETSSRGKQAYERTCPFYKIMPGMSICVDAFRYGAVEGCNAYFLSHFHSDHYVGLTANWSHGPIYCSKVTGSLVKSQLRTAAKYIVELEFEEPFVVPGTGAVTVTMIPANHCPGSSLFLFEKYVGRGGNGAIGGNGSNSRMQRILHCGDFRACPAHVDHPQLRPETIDRISGKTQKQEQKQKQKQKIDVCYLDTTYLNPRYSFPPQDEVISTCAEMCAALNRSLQSDDDDAWDRVLRRREGTSDNDTVSRFFGNGDAARSPSSGGPSARPTAAPSALGSLNPRRRLLVVCGTYSIGKERICKAIAQALRTKIYATPAKIRIVSQLGDPELTALMTPNPAEGQVHMQSLAEIRPETLADYLASHRSHFGRVVGFRPSGWNYRPVGLASFAARADLQPSAVATTTLLHGGGWRPTYGVRDLVPQRGSGREAICFGVPYSEHSSFRELAMFLMSLPIDRVVPTVNVGSEVSRRRMKAWTDRWLAERRRGGPLRVLEGDREEAQADGDGKGATLSLWDGKSGGQATGVRW